MKYSKKSVSVFLVLVLVIACVACLFACDEIGDLTTAISTGRISSDSEENAENAESNSGTGDLPVNIVRNSYTVELSEGVPSSSSELSDIIDEVQTSVVIVNTNKGSGAGVIYGKVNEENASLVVTCCHVVDGASSIKVTLNDGDTDTKNDVVKNATVIGMDDDTDIAVLRIEGSDYNFVELRNTQLAPIRLGEDAIAIGNPLGAGISVTKGIISGTARSLNMEGVTMVLLQTDAAVNSGNSGGALFDKEGYLIGIVNAKSTGDTVEGIGYAIPIYDVKATAQSLISTAGSDNYNGLGYIAGKMRLGIVVSLINQSNLTSTANFSIPTGTYYYYLSSDYAINKYGSIAQSADASKIAVGQYITAVTYENSEGVTARAAFTDDFQLADLLAACEVGDTITLHMFKQITSYQNGFFSSPTITNESFDVTVTLKQYVYGYTTASQS